ncbi:MAG: CaiB/BaiF CoA-transferase family protein [Smithellaceae bacterium]|nr:CaiB/BaiF CoA-transferase family protein [Smithellaceae bacterium]
MERKPKEGPLQGIRILDLTRLYPGPLGTMMLADMGADVIKIEDVNSPDYMRFYPPYIASESAGFVAVNRSKRSLALNLKTQKGVDIFFSLVKTADIVIEQFRPGVLDEMGIGYEQSRQVKEDIIYVSLTGYGQNGPYAKDAGHDINYIGYAGILSSAGSRETGPLLPGPQLADVAGGAYMSMIACLCALWAREKTGKGQLVDVAMLDCVLPLITLQMAHYQATKINLAPGELPLSGGLACYGIYSCADGKYIAMGILESKFWKIFCEMAGRTEWIDKHLVMGEEAENLRREIASLFRTKTRDEWAAAAKKLDICITPVLDISEVETDPHLQARQMIYERVHPVCGRIREIGIPLKFSDTRPQPSGPSPALGEDTRSILEETGYTQGEIEALRQERVIQFPDSP